MNFISFLILLQETHPEAVAPFIKNVSEANPRMANQYFLQNEFSAKYWITSAFTWFDTAEGLKYWGDIANEFGRNCDQNQEEKAV